MTYPEDVEGRDDQFYESVLRQGMEDDLYGAETGAVSYEHGDGWHHIVYDGVDDHYRRIRHRVYSIQEQWCSKHETKDIIRHVRTFGCGAQERRRGMMTTVTAAVATGRQVYEDINGGAEGATRLLDVVAIDFQNRMRLRFEAIRHGTSGHGRRHMVMVQVSEGRPPTISGVETTCRRELPHMLKSQIVISAKMGTPRLSTVDDVDLSRYVCDAPLLMLIRQVGGDDWRLLAKVLVLDGGDLDLSTGPVELPNGRSVGLPGVTGLNVAKGHMSARVRLSPDVRWSRGVLVIKRMILPTTVASALEGTRMGDLIEHDLLPGDLVLGKVQVDADGGGTNTTSITVADPCLPLK